MSPEPTPDESFELEDPEAGPRSGRESWLGPLLLVPMGLVGAAVLLFLFMTWLMRDETGPEDHLQEIVSGGYNARKQAFYGLVTELREYRDEERLAELQPAFDERVARAFDEMEADRVMERVALASALVLLESELAYERVATMVEEARAGGGEVQPATPLEKLGVVGTEHLNPLVQGILMLGQLGDVRASPLLVGLLADPDPGIRMVAASALGTAGSQAALDPLRGALGDGDREVRRNAALSLARHQDRAGLEVLIRMLSVDEYQGYERAELQAQAMLLALIALRELRASEARSAVEALVADKARCDPGVVSAAMRWLEVADAGWAE